MANVDPDLLETDATDYWQKWSHELADWRAKLADLTYTRADFSMAPGSDEVMDAFGSSILVLGEYLHTGEEIFEGFARALLTTALEYMRAEGDAQSEIDTVVREIHSL